MKENGKVKSAQSLRVTAARLVSDFSLNKVENEKKIKTVEFSAGFFSPGPCWISRVHITFKLYVMLKYCSKLDPVLVPVS